MSNVIPFNFNANQVRVINHGDGELWFVLSDLCQALQLSNPTKVASRLDADERSYFRLGRQGEVTIINESGLYSVILRSDKPLAKPLKKWVTAEVLPSLRKNGSYSVKQKTKAVSGSFLKLCIDILKPDPVSKLNMLTRAGELNGEDVAFLPRYVNSEGVHHSLTELLKKHNSELSAQKAGAILADLGYIETKTRNSKNGEKEFKCVTEKGKNYGCNLVNPNNPNETQPHWFDNKFAELLIIIEAQENKTKGAQK